MTDTTLALPTKEVERTNKQVTALQTQALDLLVATAVDMPIAASILEDIKSAEKIVITRKEEITRPLMSSLARVRDLFKPMETSLAFAKKTVKDKVLAYEVLEEQKRAVEEARIAKKVANGTMKETTATNKLAEMPDVTTKSGRMVTKTIKKLDIYDEMLIPREYLVVDRIAVTTALKNGVVVPGAQLKDEKIIAA